MNWQCEHASLKTAKQFHSVYARNQGADIENPFLKKKRWYHICNPTLLPAINIREFA